MRANFPPLYLGNSALTRGRIRLTLEDLARHWHVAGKTGHGKTKALEILCRYILDTGHALVLIDGKGDCFDAVLRYCIEQGYQERIAAIIDPTQRDWAVGLNYLEVLNGTEPSTLSRWVIEGMKKAFREGDELKPWLEQWSGNTFLPLIKLGMTLTEMEDFASVSDPTFRDAAWAKLGDGAAIERRRWANLEAMGTHQVGAHTGVVHTRATLISNSEMARAMFGQTKTTLDWRKVLDEGGIVLVRAHEHTLCDAQLADLIAVTCLHQIKQATMSRIDTLESERPDAWVVADEFQRFLSDDWKDALAQFRSFRVWLMLSNQEFSQIEEELPALAKLVLGECTGKLYFSLSHDDASRTVHELFQDRIHGEHVKHVQTKVSWWLSEEERVVRGKSHTDAHGSVESYMDFASDGSVIGWAEGLSDSFGPLGTGPSGQVSSTISRASASSGGSGSGKAESHVTSDAETEVTVPFIKPYPWIEEAGRTWYTPDEIVQRAIYWLMKQDTRRAQLKIGNAKTIPIVTRFVRDPIVLCEEVAEGLAEVMARCALPFQVALRLPEERRAGFIAAYKNAKALAAERELALDLPQDEEPPRLPVRFTKGEDGV